MSKRILLVHKDDVATNQLRRILQIVADPTDVIHAEKSLKDAWGFDYDYVLIDLTTVAKPVSIRDCAAEPIENYCKSHSCSFVILYSSVSRATAADVHDQLVEKVGNTTFRILDVITSIEGILNSFDYDYKR